MTIHVNAETVRALLKKHAQNLNPGKLIGDAVKVEPNDSEWFFLVEVLDQSPFDLPPEKVKAGFDRARDAVRRATELDAGEGVG